MLLPADIQKSIVKKNNYNYTRKTNANCHLNVQTIAQQFITFFSSFRMFGLARQPTTCDAIAREKPKHGFVRESFSSAMHLEAV